MPAKATLRFVLWPSWKTDPIFHQNDQMRGDSGWQVGVKFLFLSQSTAWRLQISHVVLKTSRYFYVSEHLFSAFLAIYQNSLLIRGKLSHEYKILQGVSCGTRFCWYRNDMFGRAFKLVLLSKINLVSIKQHWMCSKALGSLQKLDLFFSTNFYWIESQNVNPSFIQMTPV